MLNVTETSDYIHASVHLDGHHSGLVNYRLGPTRREWEWQTQGGRTDVSVNKEEYELLQQHRANK